MNTRSLAKTLLASASAASLLVPQQLAASIGPEALQDALTRGWVQPDMESGYLCLSGRADHLAEMRRLAESPCPCGKPDCACESKPAATIESSARPFAMHHAHRNVIENLLAPGVGQTTRPGASAPGPSTAPAPSPSPGAKDDGSDLSIGETVVTVSDGKTYTAAVKARQPDGSYQLSFGSNRPMDINRPFKRQEIQRAAPAS